MGVYILTPHRPVTMAPSLVLLPLLISAALAQSNFRCPEKDGYFPDPVQCDKYYDCYDGVAEEVLCPDGMVFNPYSGSTSSRASATGPRTPKDRTASPPP